MRATGPRAAGVALGVVWLDAEDGATRAVRTDPEEEGAAPERPQAVNASTNQVTRTKRVASIEQVARTNQAAVGVTAATTPS